MLYLSSQALNLLNCSAGGAMTHRKDGIRGAFQSDAPTTPTIMSISEYHAADGSSNFAEFKETGSFASSNYAWIVTSCSECN
jgi:hypothetical protein